MMFEPLTHDEFDVLNACRDGWGCEIDQALTEARRMIEDNKRALELLVAARKARSYRQSMQLLDAIGLVLGEKQAEIEQYRNERDKMAVMATEAIDERNKVVEALKDIDVEVRTYFHHPDTSSTSVLMDKINYLVINALKESDK